jgi:hypothetical protein
LVVVLSIGKLATGQANYYLQQVERRIDRVTSVASGVEDYYLSEGEAAGEWIGSGPAALGLQGTVDDEQLHRVLGGEDPATGDLLRSTRGTRVPGFDLTFSAPKSVSVLFGICDNEVRGRIERGPALPGGEVGPDPMRSVRGPDGPLRFEARNLEAWIGGGRVTKSPPAVPMSRRPADKVSPQPSPPPDVTQLRLMSDSSA